MTAESPPAWNVFKQIFIEHWDGFKRVHPRYDQRYYDGLVDKMLGGGNPDKMGFIEYRCLQGGAGTHRVAMSCKSSLCLRCAKVYVDTWGSQVSQMLHAGVMYRHIVLTVPAILGETCYQQSQAVLSPFMRCGVRCLDDVFSRASGKNLKGGYIVVIQPHGRNGPYNPHLHVIATSGGWDQQRRLVDACYARYREGFVTNVQKGDGPARYQSLATYLGKYGVSPPISLRGIDRYDGYRVTYHYRSHKSEQVERETVESTRLLGAWGSIRFPKASNGSAMTGCRRPKPWPH
jgi:Transposase zinc-binding domain/Putative transposase